MPLSNDYCQSTRAYVFWRDDMWECLMGGEWRAEASIAYTTAERVFRDRQRADLWVSTWAKLFEAYCWNVVPSAGDQSHHREGQGGRGIPDRQSLRDRAGTVAGEARKRTSGPPALAFLHGDLGRMPGDGQVDGKVHTSKSALRASVARWG